MCLFSHLWVKIALSHRHVEKLWFPQVKRIQQSTAHTFTVWARARPGLALLLISWLWTNRSQNTSTQWCTNVGPTTSQHWHIIGLIWCRVWWLLVQMDLAGRMSHPFKTPSTNLISNLWKEMPNVWFCLCSRKINEKQCGSLCYLEVISNITRLISVKTWYHCDITVWYHSQAIDLMLRARRDVTDIYDVIATLIQRGYNVMCPVGGLQNNVPVNNLISQWCHRDIT